MLRKYLVYILVLGLTNHSFAENGKYYYSVKTNDIISEILYRARLRPIFAKSVGSLAIIQKVNADHITNINKIYPGDKIYFPDKLAQKAQRIGLVKITPNNELVFIKKKASRSLAQAAQAAPPTTTLENPPLNPLVKPTSEPKKVVLEEVRHTADVFTNYRFLKLSLTDLSTATSALFTSKIDFELGASWAQHWSPEFNSYFLFSARHIEFNKPTSLSGKTLAERSQFVSQLQLGGVSKVSSRSDLKYFVNYGGEVFIRGLNTTELSVDTLNLPSLGVNYSLDFFKKDATHIGSYLSGQYLLATGADSYSAKEGQRLGIGFYLKKIAQEYSLEVNLGYKQKNQNTSITNQAESEIFGALFYQRSLFQEEKGTRP